MDVVKENTGNVDDLKKTYLALNRELKKLNEELVEQKRIFNIKKSTQEDYLNENKLQMSKLNELRQKYANIIKEKESKIIEINCQFSKEREDLEKIITTLEEENEGMKMEMGIEVNIVQKRGNTSLGTTVLIDEILSESTSFNEDLGDSELKRKINKLAESNVSLESKVEEITKELKALKEKYEYINCELLEATDNQTFLLDEKQCILAEFDELKSRSSNDQKNGNSLFAEVDERRIDLQEKINNMKSNYLKMVQKRDELKSNVRYLEMENRKILDQWEAAILEIYNDHNEFKFTKSSTLSLMEAINQQYIQELEKETWFINEVGMEELNICDQILKELKQEIDSTEKEVLKKSRILDSLNKRLKEANDIKSKWNLKVKMLKEAFDLLKSEKKESTCGEENIENSLNKYSVMTDPRDSIQKHEEKNNYEKENYSCLAEKKKVTFA